MGRKNKSRWETTVVDSFHSLYILWCQCNFCWILTSNVRRMRFLFFTIPVQSCRNSELDEFFSPSIANRSPNSCVARWESETESGKEIKWFFSSGKPPLRFSSTFHWRNSRGERYANFMRVPIPYFCTFFFFLLPP